MCQERAVELPLDIEWSLSTVQEVWEGSEEDPVGDGHQIELHASVVGFLQV